MISTIPAASTVLVAGVVIMLAAGCAGAAVLLRGDQPHVQRMRQSTLLQRERDLAAALGWRWRWWVTLRVTVVVAAALLGVWSGLWVLGVVLIAAAAAGTRFVVAGRALRRRLRAERAFMMVMRELRDRIAVSNQSLDTALVEIATAPPRELQRVLAPLAAGGDITMAIVECGERARSPLIEQACGVLLWARARSLDALITAVDDVVLPVGEAQLAVEEESLVTLSQQRAVTFAMAALMLVMFVSVMRVASFRAYYGSPAGTLVLLTVVVLFGLLIAAVGRIARVGAWTRWDLRSLRREETPDRV